MVGAAACSSIDLFLVRQRRFVALGQVAGALRPVLGIFGQADADHFLDVRRHPARSRRSRRRTAAVPVAWASSTSMVEPPENGSRPVSSSYSITPTRVQVAAVVHLLAADLLRADVAGRADGEVDVGVGDLVQARRRHQLGQAEVHHLDLLVRRVGIDHHQVGRLQVAVDDALAVGGLEHLAELAEQPADARRAEPAVAVQQRRRG